MKKIAKLILVLTLLLLPTFAHAQFDDDFSDGIMNTELWDLIHVDPDGRVIAAETPQPGVLGFTTNFGWNMSLIPESQDEYHAFTLYSSKWTFALNNTDFTFSTDYHYSHITEDPKADGLSAGGLLMGLYGFDRDANLNTAAIGPGNVIDMPFYSIEGDDGVPFYDIAPGDRVYNDGTLRADYSAEDDILTLAAFDVDGLFYEEEFDGLRGDLGLTEAGVFLGGYSDGAHLLAGEAYFSNFQVTDVTVTPEPLSMVLFLVGGLPLGFNLMKKRS